MCSEKTVKKSGFYTMTLKFVNSFYGIKTNELGYRQKGMASFIKDVTHWKMEGFLKLDSLRQGGERGWGEFWHFMTKGEGFKHIEKSVASLQDGP